MAALSPGRVTCFALIFGLAVPLFLWGHQKILALLFLSLSGFCDTLDGSLARKNNKVSIRGAALDLFADRIVEAGVVLGLYLWDPTARATLSLFMLISILLCITSFLISAATEKNSSEKSFHYSPGIMERAEAFTFFAAMILFPSFFQTLAIAFTFLVTLTGVIRMVELFRKSA